MTTTEPNADEQKRGRHAKTEDADRHADPDDDREPAHAATDGPDDDSAEPADATKTEPEPEADDEPTADGTTVPENSDDNRDDDRDEAVDTDEAPADEPAGRSAAAASPTEQSRRPETREEAKKKRSTHAIAHHPGGASLLTSAGLVTGLALAPLLFDALRFEVAVRAGDTARSAAAPWPAGGEPWFWPGWVATLATVVAVVVLVVAAVGLRLPDVAVLATASVLAVTTARASWATIAVLNAHLWELVPVCIVCLAAFGSAGAAVFRWRSSDGANSGTGAGEVAGVTIGAWLLVVLLLLGGSAIASSAQTHAFGNVTSPPQDLAGLLSVRSADFPAVDDLHGSWVAQVGAAQVTDDAAATAYAVTHHGFTTRFPTLLARGDDVGAPGLDDTWWLSLAAQPFRSSAEAAAWCSASGVAGCAPLLVSG